MNKAIMLRGENIHEIGHWINLSKIHKASQYTQSKRPQDWRRSNSVKSLIKAIENAYDLPKDAVIASRKGNRTIAHYNLALAYAAYLDLDIYAQLLPDFESMGWPLLVVDELLPPDSKVPQEEPWTRAIARFWDEFFVEAGHENQVSIKVENPVGIADIVLKLHVVEVKRFCQWKGAMGQALAYAHVMNLKPAIALFDVPWGADLSLPLAVCTAHGVMCHIFLGSAPGHWTRDAYLDNVVELDMKNVMVEVSE